MNFFLFQIYPYIALAFFILGSILRFDRDPYTWKSKSSQLLRRRQLIIGSVLFHLGVIVILAGHFVGLLTPIAVFDALGISHQTKQILAMAAGGIAGVFCLTGLIILIHRRLTDNRVWANTSTADMLVLFILLGQVTLGLATIPVSMRHLDGHEMVKFMEWAQHVVTFRGGAADFIADVDVVFKLHITLGLTFLLIVPFTRLVHFFSAPVNFLFRPYQIVRKRAV